MPGLPNTGSLKIMKIYFKFVLFGTEVAWFQSCYCLWVLMYSHCIFPTTKMLKTFHQWLKNKVGVSLYVFMHICICVYICSQQYLYCFIYAVLPQNAHHHSQDLSLPQGFLSLLAPLNTLGSQFYWLFSVTSIRDCLTLIFFIFHNNMRSSGLCLSFWLTSLNMTSSNFTQVEAN